MNSTPDKTVTDANSLLFDTLTRRYIQTGIIFGFVFPIAATLLKLSQLGMPFTLPNIVGLQLSESLLWVVDTAPVFLGLAGGLIGKRQDALSKTNNRLREREEELTAIHQELEQRVAERTRQLDERNSQMRASVHFSRQIAEIQDVPDLLEKSVELISQHFNQYDASIFLMDDQRKAVVLQATSSEPGKQKLERGYRVVVGDPSLIGRVAESGRLQSIQRSEPVVHSEIALPLIVRGAVIGVLDVQSEQPAAFAQADAEILQLLADQIASSIENARLLSESQAIVSQLEILTAQQTRAAWQEYLGSRKIAYQFTLSGVKAMPPSTTTDGATKQKDGLSVPIILRGQQIGSIALHRQDNPSWADRERDLAEKVATQVALALDNNRLLVETRQRAQHEQTVSEISSRLSRSLDLDTLLQTAARELGALPDVAEVSVFIGPSLEDASKETTNG